MTADDLPWLHDLCVRRYPKHYDSHTTEAWYKNIVLSNPLQFIAIRTDRAFSVAHLEAMPWTAFELECCVMFTCAEEGAMWEAVKCLRMTLFWARQRKCKRWHLWSETTFELGPMAKRLGINRTATRYIKDL